MKKLAFLFVAFAAISFASCGGNKTGQAATDCDSAACVDSAAVVEEVADSAALVSDSAVVDSAAAAAPQAQ